MSIEKRVADNHIIQYVKKKETNEVILFPDEFTFQAHSAKNDIIHRADNKHLLFHI